ncbi:MAG: hypothetical protein ABSB22_19610 [Thermodesulfobacteriota bacterium]|jgi:hypothetical protein
MPTVIDKEIQAIGTVLKVLEPLDSKGRQSVLNYVLQRLDIEMKGLREELPPDHKPPLPPGEHVSRVMEELQQLHIKDLVEEKGPRSAQEMATLVAYYLAYKAPKKEQKQTITIKDMDSYFKIADFKLPRKPQFTLINAKKAGYLDAVGEGEYKLNPVGYNLVVHSMPRPKKKSSPKRPQRKKNVKKNSGRAKQ